MADFTGIDEARIDASGGMPRLMINGEPVPPIIYFHNTHIGGFAKDIQGQPTEKYLKLQVAMAQKAGIHLYSIPFGWPLADDGVSPDFATANSILDAFINIDPEAVFILRVYPGVRDWGTLTDVPDEDISCFADGFKGIVSIAADRFWEPTNDVLCEFIRYYESSHYGKRILGYHPGGPQHEMFLDWYRENGPDLCIANQRRFRRWLTSKYENNEALCNAWCRPGVTLESAEIPRQFEPDRFPMDLARYEDGHFVVYHAPDDGTIKTFYDLPGEQDWIDFSDYSNDIVVERIIDWAKLVKRETGGKKLSVFCYGYTFDLPGSFSGHLRLQRALECAEIDIMMGPYSYLDRFVGGAMNCMSLTDTIAAHGKLWLNEDDMRTSLMDSELISPDWGLFQERAKDLHETINFLERNFAHVLAHRSATWWTDLAAVGTFNHPAVWEMLQQRMPLYEKLYQNPTPYRPEVALLVDEASKVAVKNDTDANYWMMYHLRDESVKTGASVGYYSLDDFIQGLVPRCKAYIFANTFRLTDGQIDSIRARLDREGATAIWIYAPGLIGPAGPDIARASLLTGMALAIQDGKSGSEGMGLLDGERWSSKQFTLIPRLIVNDPQAEALGRYLDGQAISAARIRTGHHQSIFLGEMGNTWSVLSRLLESAGVHLWTRDGSVVQTDGTFLMIHSGKAGRKSISVPAGIQVKPMKGAIDESGNGTLQVFFKEAESLWFELTPKGE